jgi:hypothetical protein
VRASASGRRRPGPTAAARSWPPSATARARHLPGDPLSRRSGRPASCSRSRWTASRLGRGPAALRARRASRPVPRSSRGFRREEMDLSSIRARACRPGLPGEACRPRRRGGTGSVRRALPGASGDRGTGAPRARGGSSSRGAGPWAPVRDTDVLLLVIADRVGSALVHQRLLERHGEHLAVSARVRAGDEQRPGREPHDPRPGERGGAVPGVRVALALAGRTDHDHRGGRRRAAAAWARAISRTTLLAEGCGRPPRRDPRSATRATRPGVLGATGRAGPLVPLAAAGACSACRPQSTPSRASSPRGSGDGVYSPR